MSDYRAAAAKLMKEYNTEVMKFPEIRELMGKLVQNAGEETIDSKASAEALRKFLGIFITKREAALGEPRRAIISYLNEIWLLGPKNLPLEFWWEMRTRFLKLLHVSIILEAFNLKSFDGVSKDTVSVRAIPQCLMFVYDYVQKECTDEKFVKVKEKFMVCCKDQSDFCDLYLNVFE